ncbi:hypothetical protein EYF80_016927 [Liparis tanakae]|uniref:Uncharacterized protein n=1 Tax=Liparis tanakae TaxID=230148 RepID=A0A4Z2I410_9TELE|nr:hypothetical protein EYF80_016927 [Liparis tanakae]
MAVLDSFLNLRLRSRSSAAPDDRSRRRKTNAPLREGARIDATVERRGMEAQWGQNTLFVPLARVLTGRQNKPRWNRVCKQACEYRHETHKLAPRPDEYASAGIGAGPCRPVIRARSQVG